MKNFCIKVYFFDKNALNQSICTDGIHRMTSKSIIEAFRLFAFGHDLYRISIASDDTIYAHCLYDSPMLKVRNISSFVRNLRISREYAIRRYIERFV